MEDSSMFKFWLEDIRVKWEYVKLYGGDPSDIPPFTSNNFMLPREWINIVADQPLAKLAKMCDHNIMVTVQAVLNGQPYTVTIKFLAEMCKDNGEVVSRLLVSKFIQAVSSELELELKRKGY